MGLASGCPGRRARRAAPDAAAVAALASPLGTVCPFGGDLATFRTAWADGEGLPGTETRQATAWEEVDGAACLRVEHTRHLPGRRPEVLVVEWLRPAGDRVLCLQRQVGGAALRLDPPQPLLVAPLTSGQAWTWAGRVGDRAATATSRVLGWGEREGVRVVTVEQTTRVDDLESVRRVAWGEGLGPVAEGGRIVVDEYAVTSDGVEASRVAGE